MTDMHPHWQATDSDKSVPRETAARQTRKQNVRAPVRKPWSPRTAAIVGILLATGVGMTFLDGFSVLRSQTSSGGNPPTTGTPLTIDITPEGVVPPSITVIAGDDIVFKNSQDIPHIVQSEKLLGIDGKPLYSQAIFPGSETHFTISNTMAPGTYTFTSATARDVVGEIIVTAVADAPIDGMHAAPTSNALGGLADLDSFFFGSNPRNGGGAPDNDPDSMAFANNSSSQEPSMPVTGDFHSSSTPVASSVGSESSSEDSVIMYSTESSSSQTSNSETPDVLVYGNTSSNPYDTPKNQDALIPRNPYAVGGNRDHPFDQFGRPIAQVSGTKAAAPTGYGKAPKTPKPFHQPSTGPEVWVVLALSAVSLFVLLRKERA